METDTQRKFNLVEFDQIKTEYGKKLFFMSPPQWIKRTNAIDFYIIHTNSIKEYIVPTLTEFQKQYVYASEADVLNVALFGMTAKEWRDSNLDLKGNIQDYADVLHLIVLTNLENLNAEMIANWVSQKDRIIKLNDIAKKQLQLLRKNVSVHRLEDMSNQLELKSKENLLDFVTILQEELIRAGVLPKDYDFEAHKELVAMQPGDVPVTYADTTPLEKDFVFKPNTPLRDGLRKFAEWYKKFYM